MIYTIALVIHILISVALVLVILSQTSKGGLDANLGGAAVNVFGGSGASKFLRKWTQILGAIFVISCLFLAFQVSKSPVKASSAAEKMKFDEGKKTEEAKTAPATTPAPTPADNNAPAPTPEGE